MVLIKKVLLGSMVCVLVWQTGLNAFGICPSPTTTCDRASYKAVYAVRARLWVNNHGGLQLSFLRNGVHTCISHSFCPFAVLHLLGICPRGILV